MALTLADMRRLAVAHSLFPPTTLRRALHHLGFVQADPIRAPARAQDLILRHRVKNYRAGDLERHYATLGIEEDFFINYGFVTREVQALMHPRSDSCVPAEARLPWPRQRRQRAEALLEFIREGGSLHPQQVDRHFSHGKVRNYWGGRSNATTHLLDAMHYQGMLRVVRRDAGIRIYAAHEHSPRPAEEEECRSRMDALVDVAVRIYAPLPLPSLRSLVRRMRFATPQWQNEVAAMLKRARERLSKEVIDGTEWYWPSDWEIKHSRVEETVRLLTPFDPVVWDRDRFELLWGWVYRFEAYTPVRKRVRGYYALPLLWREHVIGWANVAAKQGGLATDFGYVDATPPRDRIFRRELESEVERMRSFLRLNS